MLNFFSKSKIHVLPVHFFCLNTIQTYADFLFQIIPFADCSIDVFNKHLAMAFTGLSWFSFLIGYGEPETLSYQIILFEPISAYGRRRTDAKPGLSQQGLTSALHY